MISWTLDISNISTVPCEFELSRVDRILYLKCGQLSLLVMNTHFIIFKAKFYSELEVLKITVVFREILDFVFVIFFFFCCVEGTETYIQIYFSFNLLILPLSIELKHNLMVSANLVWEWSLFMICAKFQW